MEQTRQDIFLVRLADPSIRDLDILFLVSLAVALVLALRVDINDFSLHHFYKNRLVRCYLGATRAEPRKPNPFTGFDLKDEILVDTLYPTAPRSTGEHVYTGPLHIVNATLNLSTGSNLAWQERQGSSFAFTPLFTGFKPDPGLLGENSPPNGYRHTYHYSYSRRPGFKTSTET